MNNGKIVRLTEWSQSNGRIFYPRQGTNDRIAWFSIHFGTIVQQERVFTTTNKLWPINVSNVSPRLIPTYIRIIMQIWAGKDICPKAVQHLFIQIVEQGYDNV